MPGTAWGEGYQSGWEEGKGRGRGRGRGKYGPEILPEHAEADEGTTCGRHDEVVRVALVVYDVLQLQPERCELAVEERRRDV